MPQTLNILQAAVLQINIFVGMGLLSMPYAMKLSGWLGLVGLAALTALFCLSGKLIVRAFDKMPSHQPHTYPALGKRFRCHQPTHRVMHDRYTAVNQPNGDPYCRLQA